MFCIWSGTKSCISLLDPIQNQALRRSLGAFGTSTAQSLCIEVNDLPLHLRRGKPTVQFVIKITMNPNNPVYEDIFNTQCVVNFSRKQRVTPTSCIRVRET